ncbi:MAG: RNA-binding protein [Chloroherpetonaceae bacterium]|jgi:RNA recognition motif-containing protein|nr:RNA-binding protein [bacterium]HAW08255.1 RNA-binding protein [Bacteroidota bacterium]
MKIYVGNLSYNVKDADLLEIFKEYGEIASAKVITDKFTGRSKGFGFVEMPNDAEAQNAIKELNDAELDNRNIKVNEAREPEPNRGGGNYQRRRN